MPCVSYLLSQASAPAFGTGRWRVGIWGPGWWLMGTVTGSHLVETHSLCHPLGSQCQVSEQLWELTQQSGWCSLEERKPAKPKSYFSDFWAARVSKCLPGKNSCPSSTLGESALPWCGDRCVREEIHKIDSKRRKENYRASQTMVWAWPAPWDHRIHEWREESSVDKSIAATSHRAGGRIAGQPIEFMRSTVRSMSTNNSYTVGGCGVWLRDLVFLKHHLAACYIIHLETWRVKHESMMLWSESKDTNR